MRICELWYGEDQIYVVLSHGTGRRREEFVVSVSNDEYLGTDIEKEFDREFDPLI